MARRKREEFTPEQADIANDLDVAAALEAVAISEGGKIIATGLLRDVVSGIDTLCAKYKDLTLQEFVGLCADMKSKIDLFRAIKRAPRVKKDLQEILDKVLEE